MRLARLSLAIFALVTFTACSNDATGPDGPRPSRPAYNTFTMGSGLKSNADSAVISTNTATGVSAGTVDPI